MNHRTVTRWRILFTEDSDLNSVLNAVEISNYDSLSLSLRMNHSIFIDPYNRISLVWF